MAPDTDSFRTRVLAPLTVDRFFADHWEDGPVHIGRGDADHFSPLLDLTQIEALLSTQLLSYPTVQLTQSDRDITPQDYCDDSQRIIPLRALEQYAQGATLVISHAHNLLAGLARLCHDTEAALQMPSQANVYLSPAGQQGFNPHYDTHDVFILQVAGRKTFNFYSGGAQLPFEHQKHDPEQSRAGIKNSEIALQPGDSLYIPRGFVHDAQAHAEESSLHITLGVFPVSVHELLQQALQLAAQNQPELRRAVDRAVWAGDRAAAPSLQALLSELDIFSEANTRAALAQLRDSTTLTAKQDITGLLAMPQHQVTPHSTLAQRRACRTTRKGNVLTLAAQGQLIDFAEPLASAVEQLCNSGETPLQALQQLHDEQREVLARQLVQSGIFECKG